MEAGLYTSSIPNSSVKGIRAGVLEILKKVGSRLQRMKQTRFDQRAYLAIKIEGSI